MRGGALLLTIAPIVLTMGFLGVVFSLRPTTARPRVEGKDYRR